MQLEIGDLVLYKPDGLITSLIAYFTDSQYAHVGMIISEGKLIEANWCKKSNIIDFIYDPQIIDVFRIKGGLTIAEQISMVQSSNIVLDKYYDYPQLLQYILEKIFKIRFFYNSLNSKHLIICSELVDDLYLRAGINLVADRANGNVTPADISNSTLLEKITS